MTNHRTQDQHGAKAVGEFALVHRFKEQWQLALRGGEPPKLEEYLSQASVIDSPTVRQTLVVVDADFAAAWRRAHSLNTQSLNSALTDDGERNLYSDSDRGTLSRLLPRCQLPQRGLSADWGFPCGGSVGPFELIEELGRGGMGVVFKARDRNTNQFVALKMMLAGQSASETAMRRFRVEAQSAAHLDHPNIVSIKCVGESQQLPYFVMCLIEGTNLDEADCTPLAADPTKTAELLRKTALAVHYAHQRGILHRDLKPANILIDENAEPHITDFGVAKRLNDKTNETLAAAIVGTPDYMSPEQATGRSDKISEATDIYSLGSILFYLLTGSPPFRSPTVTETLTRVSQEPVRTPAVLNRRVGRDLETICLKCLEKNLANRYESARDLADELARYMHHQPIKARPISHAERVRRWYQRKRASRARAAAFRPPREPA